MAKLKWALTCIVASVDRYTNTITLTNILEEISLDESAELVEAQKLGKPILIQPGFTFASLWERSDPDLPEKAQARVTLVSPIGKQLGRAEFTLDLLVARRSRGLNRFNHFPFAGFGEYKFQLHVRPYENKKWSRAGETSLHVKRAEQAPSELQKLN